MPTTLDSSPTAVRPDPAPAPARPSRRGPIHLVVFDAGGTLGQFHGRSTVEILRGLSKLPPHHDHVIAEEARRVLHRNAALTQDMIDDLCLSLLINPEDWPTDWPGGTFVAYSMASQVLDGLAIMLECPMVVLSNLSALTAAGRMEALRHQLPQITNTYTSVQMGLRKPDARCWQRIAAEYEVDPHRMLHVGNQWVNDIAGAKFAGVRFGAYINPIHDPPPPDTWPASAYDIAVLRDLSGLVPTVRTWLATAR